MGKARKAQKWADHQNAQKQFRSEQLQQQVDQWKQLQQPVEDDEETFREEEESEAPIENSPEGILEGADIDDSVDQQEGADIDDNDGERQQQEVVQGIPVDAGGMQNPQEQFAAQLRFVGQTGPEERASITVRLAEPSAIAPWVRVGRQEHRNGGWRPVRQEGRSRWAHWSWPYRR